MRKKSPLLAGVLSLVIAGVGQFYIGRIIRGLFFLSLEFLTGFIAFKTDSGVSYTLNFLVSLWAAFDAYVLCKKMNQESEVTDLTRNKRTKETGLRVY